MKKQIIFLLVLVGLFGFAVSANAGIFDWFNNMFNQESQQNFGGTFCFPSQGCTGTSTNPSFGHMLVGNSGGTYTLTATSSLGITGTTYTATYPITLTGSAFGTAISTSTLLSTSLTKGNFIVGNDAGVAQATSSIFISSTGNLGIGTTSPQGKLHIVKTAVAGAIYDSNGALVIEDNYPYINLVSPNNLTAGIFFGDPEDANVGRIAYLHSTNYMHFNTNDLNRMGIDSAGNVGIGTSTPYAKLSVHAGATDTYQPTLFSVASSTTAYATSTLFTILASGNVGIGTTSPGYKLSVAGSGYFDGGTVIGSTFNATSSLQIQNWKIATSTVVCMTPDICQFQADGTADEVTINAAIDAVAIAGGGKVHIKVGNFIVGDSVIMKDNTILEGEGRYTIIKASDTFSGTAEAMIKNQYYVSSATTSDIYNYGLTIRDLKLDGNNSVLTTTEVGAIYMQNMINVLIENTEIVNTRGYAAIYLGRNVYAPGGTEDRSVIINANWWVQNNTIDGHRDNADSSVGIWVIGLDRVTKNIHITNNVIKNLIGVNLAEGCGIMASKGVQDVVINGNIIHDNGFIGINVGGLHAYASTSKTDNITITDNLIYNIAGKTETSAGGIHVSNNWDHLTITGNTIRNVNANGITVNFVVATATQAIVSNNIVENTGRDATLSNPYDRSGIYVHATGTMVTNNKIIDTQDTPTQQYGIYEYGGKDNVYSGNYIKGNVLGAIYLPAGSNSSFLGNKTINSSEGLFHIQGGSGVASTTLTVAQAGTGDILNLFDGTVEMLTVLESGNVGIGTTSPYAKLSVVGQIVADYFTATSTTATSTIAGGLAIETSGFVYDYSSGNVGIGTTGPMVKLDVRGPIRSNTGIVGALEGSAFGYNTYYNGGWKNLDATKTGIFFRGDQGSMLLYSAVAAVSPTVTIKGGWVGDIFYNLGNVGIGTTTPYSKLTVWGPTSGNAFEIANTASTTIFSVTTSGFGTTTLAGLNISGQATSTSNVGWNLSAGCYAIGGTCIGGSTYTATYPITLTGSAFGIAFGTTTSNTWAGTQTLTYASTTALSVGVDDTTTGLLTIYGDNADTGGIIRMWNSVNQDGTEEWWQFSATGTQFNLGIDESLDTFKFYSAGNFAAAGNVAGATYGSDASVSNAELLYINTLSSNAQTQLNAKQATISATWPITLTGVAVGFNGLSTSTAAVLGNIPYFSGVNTFANAATSSLTATYPLSLSGATSIIAPAGITLSTALGTTTANTWAELQTFTSGISVSGDTITDFQGDGFALSGSTLIFDCSDVASTGLTCSGEDLIVDSSVILSTEIDTIAEINAILTGEDVASTTWAGASSIVTVGALTAGSLNTGFTAVNVAQGGTGASTFGQGWLHSAGGTANLTSSTSPTVNYLTATSTTLASRFPYASSTSITISSLYANPYNRPILIADTTGTVLQSTDSDANDGIHFKSLAGTDLMFINNSGLVVVGNDTTPDASLEIINDGSGNTLLVQDTNDGDVSPFVINGSGNVGIGTTTPYAKLSVVGETVALYFTATSTTATSTFGGNVYVKGNLEVDGITFDKIFDDETNVKDIQSFVERERHLPFMDGYLETKARLNIGKLLGQLWESTERLWVAIFQHEERIDELEIRIEQLEQQLLKLEK